MLFSVATVDILIEVSLGISQSLQTNSGVILRLSHEDFLPNSSNSLFTDYRAFDAMCSELLIM
jgi:hypothetical protein